MAPPPPVGADAGDGDGGAAPIRCHRLCSRAARRLAAADRLLAGLQRDGGGPGLYDACAAAAAPVPPTEGDPGTEADPESSVSSPSSSSSSSIASAAFQLLHRELAPALLPRSGRGRGSGTGGGAAALLLGPPNSGKARVLAAVLRRLRREAAAAAAATAAAVATGEAEANAGATAPTAPLTAPVPPPPPPPPPPPFRTVLLDGRVLPGHATGAVVREILRQLTEDAALAAAPAPPVPDPPAHADGSPEGGGGSRARRKRRRSPSPTGSSPRTTSASPTGSPPSSSSSSLLPSLPSLRRRPLAGSFLGHMDLLQQILRFAALDGRPVLVVLRHLELFVANGGVGGSGGIGGSGPHSTGHNPQLLLYHLLDRVGQAEGGLALVATSRHAGLLGLLEKRVQSRLAGSARLIHMTTGNGGGGPGGSGWAESPVRQVLAERLVHARGLAAVRADGAAAADADAEAAVAELSGELHAILLAELPPPSADGASEPEPDAVRDTRAVRALLTRSLALGRDLLWFLRIAGLALSLYREDCRRALSAAESADDAAADDDGGAGPAGPRHAPRYWLEALQDLGAGRWTDAGRIDVSHTPRLRALRDLSGPQAALLLTARRILLRDTYGGGDALAAPLTLERVLQEYRRFQGTANRYAPRLLRRALRELLRTNAFRPSADHSGGGPFQYRQAGLEAAWDDPTLARAPLQLTYDVRRELGAALERNGFPMVSTAFCDWAKSLC